MSSSGWISTSRNNKPSSSSSLTEVMTKTLPLDWTRVKRKRNDDDEECCNDPEFCRRHNRYDAISSSVTFSSSSSALVVSDSNKERIYKGYAIFCLHDVNPGWFQGYYFASSSSSSSSFNKSPLRILAVQEEIDKCLECVNGGYRRLTVNIFDTTIPTAAAAATPKRIQGIDWTGGDMVTLTNDKLIMETQRLLTGKETVPFLKKYFRKLLEKIYDQCNNDAVESSSITKGSDDDHNNDHTKDRTNHTTIVWDEATILDLLPNVAIVIGPMSFVLSKEEKDDEYKNQPKRRRTEGVVRADDDGDKLWKDEKE